MSAAYEVCVIGGAGHVGVPLALVLADNAVRTLIYDINSEAVATLQAGKLPFLEEGGKTMLARVLRRKTLGFASQLSAISGVPILILTIGTPIDEFHNPRFSVMTKCLDELLPHLDRRQTIILRSTMAPGMVESIDAYLKSRGKKVDVAFCPERVVQGRGVVEIQAIPQLVSATSPRALRTAKNLFSRIAPAVIEVTPREAELGKLVCNAYRYIQFAATNQLYMLVESAGVDYKRLLEKMRQGYHRLNSIPGPGFAAGPCLMKDTMQLFSMGKYKFPLGQTAVLINEGLPDFIIEKLAAEGALNGKTVGILGMAFKADSDDIRESLAYKLRKLLRLRGAEVICSDEYVRDRTFLAKEDILRRAEVVIIGVPHSAYKNLSVPKRVRVIDLWGCLGRGSRRRFSGKRRAAASVGAA